MIWFSCTKCQKPLSRPDTSAGAFVFCECGQGMVVPWESTISAPSAAPKAEGPSLPAMDAVPIGEEQIPVARPAPSRDWSGAPSSQGRAWPRPKARDPEHCFNHQDRAGKEKCADCGENFCSDCLVKLKEASLCGPCKNWRLRDVGKPSSVSGKALVGMILAACFAPLVTCLVPLGGGEAIFVLGGFAVLGQLAAMLLAGLALRKTEQNTRISGKSLAITTLVAGSLAMLVTVCVLILRH